MTPRSSLLAQARQGNPSAIATLINQSLKTKATVQVRYKNGVYQFLVQAPEVPNQAQTVQWLRKGLTTLAIPNLRQVVIWGQANTAPRPAWQHRMDLVPVASTESLAPVATANPSSPVAASTPTPAPQKPLLGLSNYCFTRNTSLLSGPLTAPSPAIAHLVIAFDSLSKAQKLELLPRLKDAFRDQDSIEIQALSAAAQDWFTQFSRLDAPSFRKLAIWLSRYCLHPEDTIEQLQPMAADSMADPMADSIPAEPLPESLPESLPEPLPETTTAADSSKTRSVRHSANTARIATPQSTRHTPNPSPTSTIQMPMPAWVIAVGWSICLGVVIMLGMNATTVTSVSPAICDTRIGGSDAACELVVNLAGKDAITKAVKRSIPANAESQARANKICEKKSTSFVTEADILRAVQDVKTKAIPISSQTDEIFTGVLLSDVLVQKKLEGPDINNSQSTRIVCLYSVHEAAKGTGAKDNGKAGTAGTAAPGATELTSDPISGRRQEVVLEKITVNSIAVNWPNEPYSKDAPKSQKRYEVGGLYGLFFHLGAYVLFSFLGIFLAVILFPCYTCDSMAGLYQAAGVVGLVETAIFYLPLRGHLYDDIIATLVALAIASLIVPEFTLDWREKFGPLALGWLVVLGTQVVLQLLLFTVVFRWASMGA